MMEGRWTITSAYDDHEVMDDPVRVLPSVRGPEQREPIPVVPCDDAAIERATEAAMTAIVESDDVIAHGEEPFPGWALKLAERAIEAGLRAAGETP